MGPTVAIGVVSALALWFGAPLINLIVDPSYADPAAADYSLGPSSGLIDAGDPDILDLDGSRSDMGFTGGPHAR